MLENEDSAPNVSAGQVGTGAALPMRQATAQIRHGAEPRKAGIATGIDAVGYATQSRLRAIFRRAFSAGPYGYERFATFVLSLIVLGGVIGVAEADRLVESVSLVPLYTLPLALSALIHRLRFSIGLSFVCLAAHHVFGPTNAGVTVQHFLHDAVVLAGFVFVVVVVHQLGHQRRQLAQAAQRQRDELAAEIEMAAEVQQSILPRAVPVLPGFDIAAQIYPAKIVAGDYYGLIELPDGDLGVVIADVSGKGVAAGLLMPSIAVALRLDAPRADRTSDLIHRFNEVVFQVTGGTRFISLFYAKLSPRFRRLEYTNGGHNPPLLLRPGGASLLLECGGPVLGVVPAAQYESQTMDLHKGDVLVLYTDGIVEAENSLGEFYSVERLQRVALQHSDKSAKDIMDAIWISVLEFRGNDLADDATLVVVKLL
jgi:sigma-B regulation protein RsbU (phosphoserine phosphatase)